MVCNDLKKDEVDAYEDYVAMARKRYFYSNFKRRNNEKFINKDEKTVHLLYKQND